MALHILGPIRNVYTALHQGTNAAPTRFSASTSSRDVILKEPSSYPACNVAGHIRDDSAPTTLARTVPHDDAALVPASLISPDAPSSSIPTALHVATSPTDVSPFDNSHQTTVEGPCIPVTLPDIAIANVIPDAVSSVITMPRPTPETSTSTPPLSSASPPAAISLQHNADPLMPLDAPNFPSSASSNSFLYNILPTESRRSIMVTTAPSASPGPTSLPDPGAASEDDGSPKHGLCKEKDALEPLSCHRLPART
ncbi:hypothetical protein BJY52DRAFT_1287039 [Lactarius psammicola]|nr:hypothetical protein BJY52DRAFT_1287039 [Lactarius psammicola]